MSKTYHTLCYLHVGESCSITLVNNTVLSGRVLEVIIRELAEDTFIMLSLNDQKRVVRVYDSQILSVERED